MREDGVEGRETRIRAAETGGGREILSETNCFTTTLPHQLPCWVSLPKAPLPYTHEILMECS